MTGLFRTKYPHLVLSSLKNPHLSYFLRHRNSGENILVWGFRLIATNSFVIMILSVKGVLRGGYRS